MIQISYRQNTEKTHDKLTPLHSVSKPSKLLSLSHRDFGF